MLKWTSPLYGKGINTGLEYNKPQPSQPNPISLSIITMRFQILSLIFVVFASAAGASNVLTRQTTCLGSVCPPACCTGFSCDTLASLGLPSIVVTILKALGIPTSVSSAALHLDNSAGVVAQLLFVQLCLPTAGPGPCQKPCVALAGVIDSCTAIGCGHCVGSDILPGPITVTAGVSLLAVAAGCASR